MTATAMPQVQAAIYAALSTDGTVSTLTTGVFDAIPQGQQVPYVVIGEFTEIPNKAFGNNGHELTATVHIYDQDGIPFKGVSARGAKRMLAILDAVVTVLEAMGSAAVSGHTLVEVTYEFGAPMREDDGNGGIYRHMPARFRVVLEDA